MPMFTKGSALWQFAFVETGLGYNIFVTSRIKAVLIPIARTLNNHLMKYDLRLKVNKIKFLTTDSNDPVTTTINDYDLPRIGPFEYFGLTL